MARPLATSAGKSVNNLNAGAQPSRPGAELIGPEDQPGGYWDQLGSRRQGGTVWVSLSGQAYPQK